MEEIKNIIIKKGNIEQNIQTLYLISFPLLKL